MSDLIDRQAAIATAVTAAIKWHAFANPQYSIAYCIGEAIRELPSAQQWIPCSERLPEADGLYLVVERGIGWNGVKFNACASALFSQGEWRANNVVAWMPLPEPARLEEPND